MVNAIAFLPELVLSVGALALFGLALSNADVRRARLVAACTAAGVFLCTVATLWHRAILFHGAYSVDQFSQLIKLIIALGYLAVVLISGELPDVRPELKPEYFLFVTLSVAGLVALVSAVELITIVVCLELVSLPLYALVAMRRERAGWRGQMEAAIKYVVFGTTATGLTLFGISCLYGLTGSTALAELVQRLPPLMHSPVAVVGLGLAVAGLFYKLAAFPFHFWTPDVYQGGPNQTAALIASLPKIGAVAVLVRFAGLAGPENGHLVLVLSVFAVCSMLYGNLIALVQRDLKRLFGFSAIAHAGYALIGLAVLGQEGYTAALFHVISYAVMVLACFAVICRVAREGENLNLEDLAGLWQRAPLLGATLLVGVFGLAGVPPLAGFMGKLLLLKSALAQGYLVLFFTALVNTVIAIYYYLQIIREAFFREPGARPLIELDTPTRLLCTALMAVTILLGIAPGWLLDQLSACTKIALLSVGGNGL
ncbi:MAG: NADH-quinone oxidoreductase subunit N [Verrucomicrobiae bacterium]|nr:NADH-quinone oxidoreductase subunit N [Verrucomicrobiae bacterium]